MSYCAPTARMEHKNLSKSAKNLEFFSPSRQKKSSSKFHPWGELHDRRINIDLKAESLILNQIKLAT